ncbi:hypothetical protein VNO78_10162 [Psophocarpus tetragonolobus]|uniref:RING-type E3 ubiquitin transferase n=1 Tax=Psophocarpus tetragonolobus TaxID=3891 RepID=A0AAN9SKT7_PSOTE
MDNNNDNANLTVSESNNNAMMPLSWALMLIDFDLDEALAVVDGDSRRPLASWKNFVSNLPTVNDVTGDDVCSVCMESFIHPNPNTDGENKRVPCGHVYHSNCITLWLDHCNSCPLCRHHIPLF